MIRKPRVVAAIFMASLSCACISGGGVREQASLPAGTEAVSDGDLQLAVITAWHLDALIGSEDLKVSVSDGIADISGTADHLLEKMRAVDTAKGVHGVVGVIDRIRVANGTFSDAVLSKAVNSRLSEIKKKSDEWTVVTEDGIVRVSGEVTSLSRRDEIIGEIALVPGIRGLEPAIVVEPETEIDDNILRDALVRRLERQKWPYQRPELSVSAGVVMLRGTVPSLAARDRLRRLVSIRGVRGVRDDLVLIGESPQAEAGQLPPPSEIRQAIAESFQLDPRIDAPDRINAALDGRVAVLTGTVSNTAVKVAARENAENVLGVSRVIDRLSIGNGQAVDDGLIAGRLRIRLDADPFIEETDIRYTVRNGIIQLAGTVSSYDLKNRVVAIAERVNGAVGVTDELAVNVPVTGMSDAQIGGNFARLLNWSTHVDPERVQFKVADGVITVDGVVMDDAGRLAVVENAYRAGATGVRNNVVVLGVPRSMGH